MHIVLAAVIQLGKDVDVAELGVVARISPREVLYVAVCSFLK